MVVELFGRGFGAEGMIDFSTLSLAKGTGHVFSNCSAVLQTAIEAIVSGRFQ